MSKIELNKMNIIKSFMKLNGEKIEKATEIEREQSREIMEQFLRKIKRKFPDLIRVINLFTLCPVDVPINISTDFKRLYYNPKRIIKLNAKSVEEIEFQIMHIILHGLLGDNEKVTTERQSKYLWLTQDQRVNDICEKLGIKGGNKNRFFYLKQMKENKPYKSCFGNYYLTDKNKAVKKKAKAAQRLIASDEHFFWHPLYVEIVLDIPADSKEEEKNRQQWCEARELFMPSVTRQDKDAEEYENMQKMTDALLGQRQQGRGAGNAHKKYEADIGKPLNYKEMLRDVFTMTEIQKPIADSIDPMLYQYGLDVYGDIPLIEPKEENEQFNISTICIAIDTSGSCDGTVAEKFLRETQALICDLSEFLRNSEIILLQCDECIQQEERMSIEEVTESKTARGELSGFGGTNFVPVFERIEEIAEIENKKIDVLIYLTDGCGVYPDKDSEYPTIFVLPNEYELDYVEIPKWIKVSVMEG